MPHVDSNHNETVHRTRMRRITPFSDQNIIRIIIIFLVGLNSSQREIKQAMAKLYMNNILIKLAGVLRDCFLGKVVMGLRHSRGYGYSSVQGPVQNSIFFWDVCVSFLILVTKRFKF